MTAKYLNLSNAADKVFDNSSSPLIDDCSANVVLNSMVAYGVT